MSRIYRKSARHAILYKKHVNDIVSLQMIFSSTHNAPSFVDICKKSGGVSLYHFVRGKLIFGCWKSTSFGQLYAIFLITYNAHINMSIISIVSINFVIIILFYFFKINCKTSRSDPLFINSYTIQTVRTFFFIAPVFLKQLAC